MEYEEFKWELLRKLNEEKRPGMDRFILEKVHIKTNQNDLDSLQLVYTNDSNIRAILYFDDLYHEYQQTSLNQVVQRVLDNLDDGNWQRQKLESLQLEGQDPTEHLTLRLINKSLNPEIAEKCAYIPMQDLIAIPRWKIDKNASILVDRDFARKVLKMTDDEVLGIARKNALSQKFYISGINEVLTSMLGSDISQEFQDELIPPKSPFYVLSNKEKEFGAIGLLSMATMHEAEKVLGEKSFYVIPSSVHEVLLIPEGLVDDPASLQEMCHFVNQTEVHPQEVLGENIYRWDGGQLQICNSQAEAIKQHNSISTRQTQTKELSRGIK